MSIESLFEREDLINNKISNMSKREQRIYQVVFALILEKLYPNNDSIHS